MLCKPVEREIRRFALLNALEFGKAQVKPVIAKVLALHPELRKNAKDVVELCERVVSEINSLSPEEIKKISEEMGVKLEKRKRESGAQTLPELPVEENVRPVFRIAPNPNGPLHIGHARMIILNDEYAKRYGGTLILRFDDTDPKNPAKRPVKEAYEMIRRDLKWLGVKWHEEIIASRRLDIYYRWFEICLKKGFAYICTCSAEEWRERVRKKRTACECRKKSGEENLRDWKKMLAHEFKEGEAVGRIKTSLEEKDPAVIDWVAFRIIDEPGHPFFANPQTAPKVWPSLDFASAIDDRLTGVTHILRGKDLAICEKRQRILYDYFSWRYPRVFVFGKIFSEKFVFSTSRLREMVEKGIYKGFDDTRLATICALRKRGITAQAIRNYIISLGLNENETKFDMEILHAFNRKVLDPVAKRFFLVRNPVEIELETVPREQIEAPLYPGRKETRVIKVSERIFVEKEDFEKFRGKEVRLMHFCNVLLKKKARVTSLENRDIPKIHWVSNGVKVALVENEEERECVAEENVLGVKRDEIVQFERVGFARCEDRARFYFAHR